MHDCACSNELSTAARTYTCLRALIHGACVQDHIDGSHRLGGIESCEQVLSRCMRVIREIEASTRSKQVRPYGSVHACMRALQPHACMRSGIHPPKCHASRDASFLLEESCIPHALLGRSSVCLPVCLTHTFSGCASRTLRHPAHPADDIRRRQAGITQDVDAVAAGARRINQCPHLYTWHISNASV
jgi:hypothetical protein